MDVRAVDDLAIVIWYQVISLWSNSGALGRPQCLTMAKIGINAIPNRFHLLFLLLIHVEHLLSFLSWILDLMNVELHHRVFTEIFLMIGKHRVASCYFIGLELWLYSRVTQSRVGDHVLLLELTQSIVVGDCKVGHIPLISNRALPCELPGLRCYWNILL